MRIVVCIKQVPVVAAMELDATTKTLKREGVPNEVSAFDIRALLKAVELREAHGGEVVVMTMGPPGARDALLECLALGADRAIHLNDRAFAGADTLATARALALALKREPFDLVLCGRNSVDAETGHIGPQIAEMLDLPQITCARSLQVDPATGMITAERECDDGTETIEASLPAVISAAEDLAPERFASKADREAAKTKPIVELHAADLSPSSTGFGAPGSPTWVTGLHTVPSNRLGRIIDGATATEAAAALTQILVEEHGLFGSWKVHEQETIATIAALQQAPPPAPIWVLAETQGDSLRRVTLELLGKARALADALRTEVAVLLIGKDGLRHVPEATAHGADRILLVEHAALDPFDTEIHTRILADCIGQRRPGVLLIGASGRGRDLAPRLAARLELGLTSDCVDLGLDSEGRLVQYKPAFGGLIVAPILSRTLPAIATVRPGMLPLPLADTTRRAVIERVALNAVGATRTRVVARNIDASFAGELDSAEIIIGVGKGIGAAANLEVIRPLADLLHAPLCTTRDVTDEGWLPKQLQVGLTGRAIAPKLYLGIAIRGAFEHMVGVRRAGIVVAINKSAKAPVFKSSDYGIVGDYAVVVPALVEKLQEVKERHAGN